MTPLIIILCYLGLLLGLGVVSNRFLKATAADYFLASRGIGPFLLLMSLFGTTMTAFALVGSSGEAFKSGIGVYGKMASWSGIIHSACFFLVGTKLWALGKRHGYMTQIQFFRDRFDSDRIGLVLFPILVGLVIPYLLIGVISSGAVINAVTQGSFPEVFADSNGGIPRALGSAMICVVVLIYVFLGGVRGTAWANAFQTIVFIILGTVTFLVISHELGGVRNATRMVAEHNPTKLQRAVHADDAARYEAAKAKWEADPENVHKPKKPHGVTKAVFFSYLFIPLSVGMFPHLFQHWLTAKSAKSFRLSVVAHPVLIMVVWVPCVLIGVWATSAVVDGRPLIPPGFSNPNAVLAVMVKKLTNDMLGGLLTAGILAAIMSSLDSQFLCIGSIFTNDIVAHYAGKDRFNDAQRVRIGRGFVILIVLITYLLSLAEPRGVFTIGVWCFSGFASLFPLVFAALYWKRVTKAGAYASVLTMAATWVWLFAESGFGKDREYVVMGVMPVTVIFAAATAALVLVSLVTKPPSRATVEKFFPKTGAGAAV